MDDAARKGLRQPSLFPELEAEAPAAAGEPRAGGVPEPQAGPRAPQGAPKRRRQPFNYTEAMRALMADVACTCHELCHVDMARVAVIFSRARKRTLGGVRATIYPLRFEGGERQARLRGRLYEMPRVMVGDQEALYVVAFRLPRFQDLPLEEKLTSVVHEMYHISPRFDGDLRRLPGGKPYHTGSQRRFDAAMARIARRYLERTTRPQLHAFLRLTFRELLACHGNVVGLRMREPNPHCIG